MRINYLLNAEVRKKRYETFLNEYTWTTSTNRKFTVAHNIGERQKTARTDFEEVKQKCQMPNETERNR